MIEHIPYKDGAQMLCQCFRVLRRGVFLRVATPDLERLLRAYTLPEEEDGREYVSWTIKKFGLSSCQG